MKIKAKTVEQVIEQIRLKVEKFSGKQMNMNEVAEWHSFLDEMADELHRIFTKDTLEMIPIATSLEGCPFMYCDKNTKCKEKCRYAKG